MIKEIIFDCFGVLTQDGWTELLKQYSNDEIYDELSDLNHRVDKGLMDFDEFAVEVSKISGTSKKQILDILVNSYYPETEVFNLIADLKKHYRIGLISNISASIEEYLPTAPKGLFETQTLSYIVGVAKPSIEIFETHLAKTGTVANQAVFIDDREANCAGARAAGLHAIWFKDVDQLKTELTELSVQF